MIIVLVQLALFIFIQYHLVPLLKRPTCTIWMLILGGFKCCINRMISSHPMIPKRPGMIRWSRWRLRFGKAFDYSTILTYILTYIYIYWLYINYSIQNFRIIEHIELWNEMKSHWYFGWKPVEIPFHNQIQNCKCPLGARREPPPPVILVEGDFLELGEVEAKALVPFEALGDGNIVVKFDEVFLHWLLRLWLTTKDVIDDDWLLRIWLTIIGY